jgi:hypothetical protein
MTGRCESSERTLAQATFTTHPLPAWADYEHPHHVGGEAWLAILALVGEVDPLGTRRDGLDAFLDQKVEEGYVIETRTDTHAIISRRPKRLRRFTSGADPGRYVVEVDEDGVATMRAAEPRRTWSDTWAAKGWTSWATADRLTRIHTEVKNMATKDKNTKKSMEKKPAQKTLKEKRQAKKAKK